MDVMFPTNICPHQLAVNLVLLDLQDLQALLVGTGHVVVPVPLVLLVGMVLQA